MKAGRLDRRITIYRVVQSVGEYGDPVETASRYQKVWAAVEHLVGRELVEARQINPKIETRFTIRYKSGVTPLHRIGYEGREYDIVHVAEATQSRMGSRFQRGHGRKEALEILGAARND